MPGTTPVYGIPYPTPTDRVADGADAIKATALAVDDTLADVAAYVPTITAARDQALTAITTNRDSAQAAIDSNEAAALAAVDQAEAEAVAAVQAQQGQTTNPYLHVFLFGGN